MIPVTSPISPPLWADLVVYGATPGGIAASVVAAREGMRVILVHHHRHVGGMMSNGLGILDTIYDGKRAPFCDEVHSRISAHYRDVYGEGSPNHLFSLWPNRGKPGRPTYEPHVAEQVFEGILFAEKNLTVLREFYPSETTRMSRTITSVTFRRMNGDSEYVLAAGAFVDASYEGDLAAVAGVEMTWGRESRDCYGEPHAGRIFTVAHHAPDISGYFPSAMRSEGLNVRGFGATTGPLLPGSTGEGDRAIQAYNFRLCLTHEAGNQILVERPERYERDIYLKLRERWGVGGGRQNKKFSWNVPLLVGANFDYPDSSWDVRHACTERHRDFALGLLWFLQNDPEVPESIRNSARQCGLPKDEFTDNNGVPWEMYVRESRRLVGRLVFTEHDAVCAAGLKRAPVYADSIAITEWPIDSHSCHFEHVQGSDHEGKVILAEETRPGQIAYRCLLPKEADNLLVTGCLSASHVGWGTVRLEPVWMHVGESSGLAVTLAKRLGVAPGCLDPTRLQSLLVERGLMLNFFNDFDMATPTPEQRAAQFFGARGFFSSYDARLEEPLTRELAEIWARADADSMIMMRRVAAAEAADSKGGLTATEFAELAGGSWSQAPTGELTRGAACAWLFHIGRPADLPAVSSD